MIAGQTTKRRHCVMRSLAAACLVVCPLIACAQTMYKWVDEKGVTHFSENPPPDGARNAAKIEVKTHQPEKPAVDNWREKEQEAKERRTRQGVQDENAKRQEAAQTQRRCKDAQRRADTLENYARVFELDDKGKRVYMDESRRAAELKDARQDVARYCN
jgi:hypothetical protein